MKIIFLDIDGVLNFENAYRAGLCEYIELVSNDGSFKHYQQFASSAKYLLNKLIEETGAKIVISSTWRIDGLDRMRQIWNNEGMSGEIIGITPRFRIGDGENNYSAPRGSEIKQWLSSHEFEHCFWCRIEQQRYIVKSGIENYIIIDDDSDMNYSQRNHFVHVLPSPRNKDGFNEFYYNQALDKLSKTVIELNYED
jgi:hypothetical protein